MPTQPAPEVVRLAAQMVAAAVSQSIQGGQVAALPLEAADKQVGRAQGGWGGGGVGAMVGGQHLHLSALLTTHTCVLYCPQPLPQGWEPSYALANMYRDGSAGIGGHSDRLTKLGPCPIIARCACCSLRQCGGLLVCLWLCCPVAVHSESKSTAGAE